MKTLKLFGLISILFLTVGNLSAQSGQGRPEMAKADKMERSNKTPEERAKMRAEMMKKELNLTDEQAKTIEKDNLEFSKKLEDVQKRHRDEMEKLGKEREARMKKVLNEEQMAKMYENRGRMKERAKIQRERMMMNRQGMRHEGRHPEGRNWDKHKKGGQNSKVVFVGAGETNSLMAKFFLKHDFSNFTVFNRSNHRGEMLANALGGKNISLAQLGDAILDFDIMVVCTASTSPIITTEIYEKLIGDDTGKKIIIDLSVPANVSKSVVESFHIQYIEIENLKSLAEKNLAFRKQEIGLAKAVISQQVNAFKSLYQQRKLARALADLPTEIKSLKERVRSEIFKDRIEMLDEPTKILISDILDYFEKKSISIPMKTAKKAFDLD